MADQEPAKDDPPFPVPMISKVDEAFPAHALDWMPAWEDIPEGFKDGNEWTRIADYWFANGLSPEVKFYPVKGIPPAEAYKVLGTTLGSFAPKHEHKIAAVGWMLSKWFEKVEDWKHSESKT